MKTERISSLAALLLAMSISSQAFALENGKWLVRARAIDVIPQEDSTVSIGGEANVNNNVVPEIDVSYFFTPNIALELIAATTQHKVKLNNTTDLGDAWLLPPTLTLQYHFTQFQDIIKPYVGAGINYTHFYNTDSGVLNSAHYNDSFGGALQAGFDVPIKNNWYFNLDVKKVWINTDVKFNGGAIYADVDINPWIIGTGIGYRF